ncbi:rho guanine nucleotide exchange factor 18 cysts isoform X2 [Arctopsyche grandis]|uniref:rho guanine nucleotide exchange factor 18 cysts isoform X2 n=1 Tax=Arctopsyche grandis TaxID=121162 RepID=UPI00406D9075
MDKLSEEHHGLISSDEAAVSSGSESSVTGAVAGVMGAGAAAGGGSGPRAPRAVPTISVTPHSPGILDEPLQHLQRIHQAVHRMRHQAFNPQVNMVQQFARLSTSCPSLNKDDQLGEIDGDCCPSPATPTHSHILAHDYSGSRKGSMGDGRSWLPWRIEAEVNEMSRRRSWTALEDITSRHKLTQDRTRQRSSMSLSSMESECDDVDNSASSGTRGRRLLGSEPRTANGGRRRAGRHTAAQSTHSLNEADLQKDFQKIVALREAESRLSPRLPLQKSISTPSIVALPHEAPSAPPLLTPSGALTESETEEEMAIIRSQVSVPDHTGHFVLQTVFDHHVDQKRRKRGSLFFRKKKDKTKKVTHQWVAPCYNSGHACDWCSKPLTNKPSLYCEHCMTTVHQNACKDNIVECTKPKISKNAINKSSSSISSKGVPKRGSLPGHGQTNASGQILNDEKDGEHLKHEGSNVSDDAYSTGAEWSEAQLTAADLGADPLLGLGLDEPDSWSPSVSKELTKSLRDKEVKRQEHIYEFIMTEKHHCLTLRVMQKMFADGLQRHFRLGTGIDRMFPRLNELWQLHAAFLGRLRSRQRERPAVISISDILLDQFSGTNAERLKSAYGEFCSRHRDAVDMYKDCAAREPRIPQFVRRCQTNPLLRKKGVPECVLFVAQRLTKYPLLIEPLIKAARDDKPEQERLHKAMALVKEILVSVDGQVAEKEKEDRKLEIYNRIDAKSYTVHRGLKFKKSDILQGNRSLRFEGLATLMQGRSKMQMVLVIVLSDCLFFLQENNNKYSFFTPDNKTGVVSLQKLLVREKAGAESRGIYLISSNPADPEMFELKVHKPKDKVQWIQAIRSAVQNCPEEEDTLSLSADDKQNMLEVKQKNIRQITRLLREKDLEYALLLEEKMGLQLRLLAATGMNPPLPPNPDYGRLVGEHTDTHSVWSEVCQAIKEVSILASSLYASGTNLSRSISSAGERQSCTYISPTLPRRAETFGGFDTQHGKAKKPDQTDGDPAHAPAVPDTIPEATDAQSEIPNSQQLPLLFDEEFRMQLQKGEFCWPPTMFPLEPPQPSHGTVPPEGLTDLPPLLTLGREQQIAAVRLSHYVYTLMCIIWQQLTTIHSLEAQLSACKQSGEGNKPLYKHNQQLEELRNLQDKLSAEKTAWATWREQESRALCEKAEQLARLQRTLQEQQFDVAQQRERLYRRLEALSAKGLLPDPGDKGGIQDEPLASGSVVSSPLSESSPTDTHKRKDSKWKSQSSNASGKQQLPINLISAQNQQKIVTAQNLPIKQQLPLKLASRGSASNVVAGLNNNAGAASSHTNISHSVVHGNQLLPLRLSQGAISTVQSANNDRRYSGSNNMVAQGYQRLVDNDASPVTSHSRTGSSPAMMGFGATLPPTSPQNANNKATRTNTYPKLPERFRVRSPDSPVNPQTFSPTNNGQSKDPSQSNSQKSDQKIEDTGQSNQKEEEIIFF